MGFLHNSWELSDNPSVACVMVVKEDWIWLLFIAFSNALVSSA